MHVTSPQWVLFSMITRLVPMSNYPIVLATNSEGRREKILAGKNDLYNVDQTPGS
jgi:hypothetical protein